MVRMPEIKLWGNGPYLKEKYLLSILQCWV